MSETKPERCPGCGNPVEIVTSAEGTSFYRLLPDPRLAAAERLAVRLLSREYCSIRLDRWFSSQHLRDCWLAPLLAEWDAAQAQAAGQR